MCLLLACLVQLEYNLFLFCLIFYFIFCCYFLETCSFLMRAFGWKRHLGKTGNRGRRSCIQITLYKKKMFDKRGAITTWKRGLPLHMACVINAISEKKNFKKTKKKNPEYSLLYCYLNENRKVISISLKNIKVGQ